MKVQILRSTSSVSFNSLTNSEVSAAVSSRQWIRRAWGLHFVCALLVMTVGVWNNRDSKKYVPIHRNKVLDQHCERAFLNVMAHSKDDFEAIVCCDGNSSKSMVSLCPDSNSLPLAGRLAKFPDAWLLPLFPLLVRILFTTYRGYVSTGRFTLESVPMTALRRLGYYIVVLNFRGWVLYVFFNEIEDSIVRPIGSTCWYHEWLRDDQPRCFGRVFDFSDHIVLYLAQILPLALLEFLHSLEFPYWNLDYNPRYSKAQFYPTFDSLLAKIVPLVLTTGIVYLYFITFLGIFKTASYFHTGTEVFVGFLVSLLVHAPLCCLQCSTRCQRIREFLFAQARYKSSSR